MKKNKSLGFIPSDQERSPYQRRNEYRQAVHPISLAIINDFENSFEGNMVHGYSMAEILKSFLLEYKAMMTTPSVDMSHWFDVTLFNNTYKTDLSGYGVTSLDTLLNSSNAFSLGFMDGAFFKQDLRYKNLIRSDLKKSPVTYSFWPRSKTYKFLKAIAVTFKSATASNSSTARTMTIARGTTNGGTYLTSLPIYVPFSTISPSGAYVSPKNILGGINFGEVPWYSGGGKGTYTYDRPSDIDPSIFCRCVSNGAGTVYNNPSSNSGVYNDTYINMDYIYTIPSLNDTIAIIQDAIDYIAYYESENTALNIEGNYDGLKTDAYEQMLNDQLAFLNNMADRVEANLMQTKLDGQAQKDALLAEIEKRKLDLQTAIAEKRASINKMNDTVTRYVQVFNAQP